MILWAEDFVSYKADKAVGVQTYINSSTGEEFKKVLARPNKKGAQVIYINLSDELKEVKNFCAQWIREHIHELQVIEVEVSDDVMKKRREKKIQERTYILCTIGEVQSDPMEGADMV